MLAWHDVNRNDYGAASRGIAADAHGTSAGLPPLSTEPNMARAPAGAERGATRNVRYD
jgi:hypothetical protein